MQLLLMPHWSRPRAHTVHVIFDDGLSRHFPTDDGSTACSTLKVFNDF